MKSMTRKIAALMMAVAMIVSLASYAQAEQPALDVQNALARGANLKLEMDMQLNSDVLLPLLGGVDGSGDVSTQTMMTSLLSAVNKLTTTVIYNQGAMSARFGTAASDLITVQGRMNPETLENSFATNLLPDMSITMDPAMMKNAMDSLPQNAAQQMTPEDMQAMVAPYGNAVSAFVNEKVLPAAQLEQGPFAVEGVATFEARTTVPVTTHGTADFLDAVLAVFKNDTKLQGLLGESLKTVQTAERNTGTEADAPADVPAMIKQMESGIADIRSKADEAVGTVRYYASPSDVTAPVYLEIETDASTDQPMFATVLIKDQEKSSDIAIALLIKGEDDSVSTGTEQIVSLTTPASGTEVTEAPAREVAPAAATDWAALHNAVLKGEDQTATLINMTIKTQASDASAESNLAFDLRAPMAGMGSLYAGIALNMSAVLGDKVDQRGTLTVSALSPAPLMTVNFHLTETDETPAEVPAGTQSVVLSETTTEAETEQLMNALATQGLPTILENLKTALPEEAGIITLLIQQMTEQPETQPQ